MKALTPSSRRKADARHPQTEERLLTVPQVAERLGTSERFPRRLIAEGRIDYVKLGVGKNGPVRIPESAVTTFIEAGTVRSTS